MISTWDRFEFNQEKIGDLYVTKYQVRGTNNYPRIVISSKPDVRYLTSKHGNILQPPYNQYRDVVVHYGNLPTKKDDLTAGQWHEDFYMPFDENCHIILIDEEALIYDQNENILSRELIFATTDKEFDILGLDRYSQLISWYVIESPNLFGQTMFITMEVEPEEAKKYRKNPKDLFIERLKEMNLEHIIR